MKKIRLIDACFPGNPSSIAGDNVWRGPEHFEWCREPEPCDSLFSWFTGWSLMDALQKIYPKRVAWLLEPPWGVGENEKSWPYYTVKNYRKKYNAIMTYDKHLLDSGDSRFKFAPHGGSWIDWDLWGMYEKTKGVCMIVSDKNESEGHKLRHEIANEFGDKIDVYGPSYQKFDRKFDVLRDYRYCVVVESVKMDYYFSEKLIDAISVGCVPVYWGCPSIIKFFPDSRIISFENISKLNSLIVNLSVPSYLRTYEKQIERIENGIEMSKQYRMPEDWMFEHYPELFR